MRVLVSGLRFVHVTESVLPCLILPFVSTAMYETSTLLFGTTRRSRPRISMPSNTEALGAAPLNGAANTWIVIPLIGSGLSKASRISTGVFDAALVGRAAGA